MLLINTLNPHFVLSRLTKRQIILFSVEDYLVAFILSMQRQNIRKLQRLIIRTNSLFGFSPMGDSDDEFDRRRRDKFRRERSDMERSREREERRRDDWPDR